MFIEKQTTKLNSCLQKNSTDINSARELKTNVYNAWYRVKIESAPLQKNVNAPDLTPKNVSNFIFIYMCVCFTLPLVLQYYE